MKTFKQLLKELNACKEAREWAGDKTTEEAVSECHRGDWLMWLAQKLEVDIKPLTLAKGLCANTVRHLMKDERSLKAVDVAIAFGKGEATIEELDNARIDAYAATATDAYAYANAANAANAAASDAASDTAAYAAYAAAAYAADNAAAVRKENQLLTANICREVLGDIIIEIVKNK